MIGEKRSLRIGETWGQLWDCAWFNFKGTIPEGVNEEDVVLLIDISGEADRAIHEFTHSLFPHLRALILECITNINTWIY